MEQPILEVRTKQLIEVDGLRFKDLNGTVCWTLTRIGGSAPPNGLRIWPRE